MASPATEVDAGGRPVRVSNPDRVIYEATERTAAVTKLQVVEYYLAVADGIMRALRDRPTALERWPKGVREGITLATRTGEHGDAFYQKRVPKGAPGFVETARVRFPSGRYAEEVCPTEVAVPAWAAQMGTITFHPWPVRRADVDHPDELRIDLDPHAGTGFGDAVRVAGEARRLLEELGLTGFPKTSGNRGVHVYVRIQPRWEFTEVRHAAIAFGRELERRTHGVTTKWWKEERGENIFVDYNQNCRDRTIASAYSLRPKPGAPVSTPVEWDELSEIDDPAACNVFTVPQRFAERGDAHTAIDEVAHSLQPLLDLFEEQGAVELPYPRTTRRCPANHRGCSRARRWRRTGTSDRARSEAGDALAGAAGLLVEVLVLEQVQDRYADPAARPRGPVEWKNSATTWGRVKMIASAAPTAETFAARASIGSALTTSPCASAPHRVSRSTQFEQSERAWWSSSGLHLLHVLVVHHHGRGGEHLARGQRPHRRLDPGRRVLDGQQHVVADRVLDLLVEAAHLQRVVGSTAAARPAAPRRTSPAGSWCRA